MMIIRDVGSIWRKLYENCYYNFDKLSTFLKCSIRVHQFPTDFLPSFSWISYFRWCIPPTKIGMRTYFYYYYYLIVILLWFNIRLNLLYSYKSINNLIIISYLWRVLKNFIIKYNISLIRYVISIWQYLLRTL